MIIALAIPCPFESKMYPDILNDAELCAKLERVMQATEKPLIKSAVKKTGMNDFTSLIDISTSVCSFSLKLRL